MHMLVATWGWALGAASLTGLVLGLFTFEVTAVVAASVLFVAAWYAVGALLVLSVAPVVIATACGLLALQGSYLIGLLLAGWVVRPCRPRECRVQCMPSDVVRVDGSTNRERCWRHAGRVEKRH